MRRSLLFSIVFAGVAAVVSVVACSGSDTNIADAGKEAGPLDTGPGCMAPPKTLCFYGAPLKACDEQAPQPLKGVYDGGGCPVDFVCPPGTIDVKFCACNADTAKVDAGADCPGNPPADSGTD